MGAGAHAAPDAMGPDEYTPTDRHVRLTNRPPETHIGHELLTVKERLHGREPTDYPRDRSLPLSATYTTTYYRCRHCGQERNNVTEFREPCRSGRRHPVSDGGYSVDDDRTRRALAGDLTVRVGEQGPRYLVDGASDTTYVVDVDAETCTCPDFEHRHPEGGCKHLRRVDIEIRVGTVPAPDGQRRR